MDSPLDLLRNAASDKPFCVFDLFVQLKVGELLKNEDFSLEETVLTIDIMKPNMDIFADASKGIEYYVTIKESFVQSVLRNSIQRQTDIHRYVRAMLMSLINWMNGASIHRTVLANTFLVCHAEILNPLVQAFAKLIGHIICMLLRAAIDTGVLNEEDLSSDMVQQKLLFHFESQLEIERFFGDAKASLRNDSQLVMAFDFLVALHAIIQSGNGDVINSLDYTRECLNSLLKCLSQLSGFLAFNTTDNEQHQEYGMIPFVEPGVTIFPPRPVIVYHREGLVEFMSMHCIPRLEKFLSTLESLDGVQLLLFFCNIDFDLHRDVFTRICIINWLKRVYELHWCSYETLFSFPFEIDRELLQSFVLWCLFQCRNLSWIHRKTVEFVDKVIAPVATIKQSKNKSKNEFAQILLNECQLKQIDVGFQLQLYSEQEAYFMHKISLQGLLIQQTMWASCGPFQSNFEFRKEQVMKASKELERKRASSQTRENSAALKMVLEKRLRGSKVTSRWNVSVDELLKES